MKRAATICAIAIVAGVILADAPVIGEIMRAGAWLGAVGLVVLAGVAIDFKAHKGDTKGIEHL